ncbi:MAG TPA: hypothetical protein VF331_16540 [Polyangiales bacterium]
MGSLGYKQQPRGRGLDAEVGHRLIEVKPGVTALRAVRMGLMELAYALADRPGFDAFLVLTDTTVTTERLRREWSLAASVLRPDLADKLSLCIRTGDRFIGIPRDPDPETQSILVEVVARERTQPGSRVARVDASFVVVKILLHHWLTNGSPVTTDWLARTCGFSYPTIASVLRGLGGLIERGSDRRVRLRWFPREEFARLLAMADRTRATVRFSDRSGQPRSPEAHLRRLEKIKPPGIALGGVLGAKHFFSDLDLVGVPRLDLSQHAPNGHADLGFVEKIDPALKRVQDPLEPASVVVHVIRHADPLFTSREGGLHWADPVECLFDLYEARLDAQASQFLEALQRSRPTAP